MKVYVLLQCQEEDYHGSGSEIMGVYASWERAFEEVRKTFKKAKRNAEQWSFPKVPCYDVYLYIAEWDVEG